MKRIDFIKRVSLLTVGFPLLLASSSCSKDDDDIADVIETQKDCLANGTTTAIGSNHDHTLAVSKSDVEAGVDKNYSIQGGSTHNHTVTITANQFATLVATGSVTVNSSSDSAHTHSVSVTCA